MKNLLRTSFVLIFIFALVVSGASQATPQVTDATGVWLANDVPYAPWVFDLKQSGTTLTGSAWQSGAVLTVANVYDGTVKDNEISFKVDGGTGGTISFVGTRSGDTIVFTRTPSRSGTVGDGLYGAAAVRSVTVKRLPPGSAPPPRPTGAADPATSAVLTTTATPPVAAPAGTEHWEATGVGFAPWTFDLKITNDAVTGVIGQARLDPPTSTQTTLVGPFEIYDGKVSGNTIEFKAKTSDGGRIITFRGVRSGDSIAFKRSVAVVSGDAGRNGILGGTAATEFVATRGTSAATAVVVAAPVTPARINVAAPASTSDTGASGRWQTTGLPSAPWTFEFTVNGTSLTGTAQQTAAPSGPVTIAGGKVSGTTISFKVLSPDAERTISFTGRVNGNNISFVREITPLPGGGRGGTDLFGAGAPLQFVATRIAANRFNFRGMSVDVSTIQSLPNRDAILESLRGQIDNIDAAITDSALKAFVQSVPLVMAANPAGADNAAYSGSTKSVLLTSASYSPEKPVILHEVMHAYHDQKLPGGFRNVEIQRLYEQARSSGQFPAGSYMLSSVGEYFAMMASVYLHGTAARDPFTRDAIKQKQPDCYNWLVKEFGQK
jgi:hypothetical protein